MRAHIFTVCSLFFWTAFICNDTQAEEHGLDFITNGHQWPAHVRYKADLPGGAVFLTNTGFTYSYYSQEDLGRIHRLIHEQGGPASNVANEIVNSHTYSVTLHGCNASANNDPQRKVANYYNYFLGNDSSKWSGSMAAYEEVRYGNIYSGIDLRVYSKGTALKYDFVLSPGADASAIRLDFDGVIPKLTPEGDILIRTSVNELREKAPYAYQLIDGRHQQIACRYVLKRNRVSFDFPEGYDHSRELIIDPVLVFVTYSGSTSASFGWSATYDTSGNLYSGSESFGTGWPVTSGAFQTTFGGGSDVAINKYSSNGTSLIYSTYYGGSGGDYPNTIVVNNAGELIVAGASQSTNLPTTSGCFDNSFNGNTDVYVAHFTASGAGLVGATYLGGSGIDGAVATGLSHDANCGEVIVDALDNIYVAFGTNSTNFPTTSSAYQTSLNGNMDAFIAKLNSTCSNLLFSTYLGGSGDDAAIAIHLGASGKVIVGGGTSSTNFPGTTGGWQSALQSGTDGFIAMLDSTGTSLLRATYVGTSGTDDVAKLQIDGSFNIYAAGINKSSVFPVSPGTYSVTNGKNYICKFDSTLSNRLLSTTIGSTSSPLLPTTFNLDVCGNIYFIAYDASSSLAVTSNAFQANPGGFWMCVLNTNMSSLLYASYFGGSGDHIHGGSSRTDPSGTVYHANCTLNSTLPTTSSVWSPTKKTTGSDNACWKFNFQLAGMKASFDINEDTFCAPAIVTFTNNSYGALSYLWDFGDGSPNRIVRSPPVHTYATPGIYRIRLFIYNVGSCKTIDSATRIIHVYDLDTVKLVPPNPLIICAHDSTRMKVKPRWTINVKPNTGVSYQPNGGTEILFFPDTTTTYQVFAVSNIYCSTPPADMTRFTIERDTTTVGHVNPITDMALCKGDTAVYQLGLKLDHFSIRPSTFFQVSTDSMSLRFYPQVTTKYQFTGLKANRCQTIRDTMDFTIQRSTIDAAFDLSPKLTDQSNPEFQLTNRSKGASTYKWYQGQAFWTTQTSPSLTVRDTGIYCFTLVATDVYNCVDSAKDCGRLIETHIYVPSAFTPNGDHKNDIFRPIMNNVSIMVFSVYNRYGERVFVAYDNKHSGWDGTYKGKPCDLGTYFYMIRYKILEREPVLLKGDVTLIR